MTSDFSDILLALDNYHIIGIQSSGKVTSVVGNEQVVKVKLNEGLD